MNDLFPDCKQDSPRLAWMKRHGVTMRDCWQSEIDECKALHDYYPNLTAVREVLDAEDDSIISYFGYGITECDALVDLACACGIPLWNEEECINSRRHNDSI